MLIIIFLLFSITKYKHTLDIAKKTGIYNVTLGLILLSPVIKSIDKLSKTSKQAINIFFFPLLIAYLNKATTDIAP